MGEKTKGICPFCKEEVMPVVLEENTVRRDKCQCPECKKTIYSCRGAGCDNYAKGGNYYDQELCPECTRAAVATAKDVGVMVAAGVLTAAAIAASEKSDKS